MVTPGQALDAVAEVMAGPVVWGASDCSASACRIYWALWGVDIQAGWRDYACPVTAKRMLLRRGVTLASALEAGATAAGLVRCAEHAGAFGAVRTDSPWFGNCAAAICIRPGEWAARTENGFGITSGPVLVMGVSCLD